MGKVPTKPSFDPPSGIGLKVPPFREPEPANRSLTKQSLWARLKSVFGLAKPADHLQVSVFGPPIVVPGQTVRVMVNLHRPEMAESVRTLARAIQNDAELLGTADVAAEVSRDTEVAVHLSVSSAGVSKSMLTFIWRGQPRRLLFELHVPWEASSGAAVGIVSVGYNTILVAKSEISLTVLPRKG